MATRGQKIFTTVLTNDSITLNADMAIKSISIILISGSGFFIGSLDVGDLPSTSIPLVVSSPVGISSGSGYPLEGLTIDCSSGGVINIIGRQ